MAMYFSCATFHRTNREWPNKPANSGALLIDPSLV
jgi:hypothetical protein